jgi:hypothetical protein
LVLKVGGNAVRFAYDSLLWSDDNVINESSTDLSETDAKFINTASIQLELTLPGLSERTRRFASVRRRRPRYPFGGLPFLASSREGVNG